jgi:hypothetical protein
MQASLSRCGDRKPGQRHHIGSGNFPPAWAAVSFTFSSRQLCVYNGLNENALERGPLDPYWRRHRLA